LETISEFVVPVNVSPGKDMTSVQGDTDDVLSHSISYNKDKECHIDVSFLSLRI
jgi:hypothetical protein